MKRLTILVILFAIVLAVGCKKDDPDPVPPTIEFLDARFSADKSYTIVRFKFFDGDGDLGLKQNENLGQQEFNLFVDYYEKINGVWTKITPIITFSIAENKYDTGDLHLRVPFLENETGGSLEGEAVVDLLYNFNADTFRYDLTLKDRAFHSSNIISTTEFIVN